MTSQDLVPDGLPHGERQKRVSQIRSAGLPNETSSVASSQGGAATASPPSSSGGVPPDFDALTAVAPSPADQLVPSLSPRDQLLQVAESAQSQIMRTILQRVASKL